jgi:hypothetical protein
MHIVECDPDVILMSSLAQIPKRRIEHGHGKHRVLRRLLKHNDSIGMIDEDPLSTQPQKYLQKFVVVDNSEENRIRTLRYVHGNDRLIVLCPRLEEWIIESCRRIHVELGRYNLSDNGNQLHEEINFKLNRFQQLVTNLLPQSEMLRTLQERLNDPL